MNFRRLFKNIAHGAVLFATTARCGRYGVLPTPDNSGNAMNTIQIFFDGYTAGGGNTNTVCLWTNAYVFSRAYHETGYRKGFLILGTPFLKKQKTLLYGRTALCRVVKSDTDSCMGVCNSCREAQAPISQNSTRRTACISLKLSNSGQRLPRPGVS